MHHNRPAAAAIGALALVPGLLVLATPTAQAAPPTCQGRTATIVVTQPGLTTLGTEGDDVIVGTDRDDVIDGRGGNDTICGGWGLDTLAGGPGDDVIDMGWSVNEIGGSEYTDLIDFSDGDAVTVDLRTGTATGQGRDTIVLAPDITGDTMGLIAVRGSRFADTFEGSSRSETFIPGPGRDTVRARGGRDRIVEEGPDWAAKVVGWRNRTDGADVYRTGADRDWIDLNSGNVDLYTGSGNDRVNVWGPDLSRAAFGSIALSDFKDPIRGTIRTGSGNDGVHTDQRFIGSVNTGQGHDHQYLASRKPMRLDIPGARFGTMTAWRHRSAGVEEWRLSTRTGTSRIRGSSRADRVTFTGPRVLASLGGGNDRFFLTSEVEGGGRPPISRIYGGAGIDTLNVGRRFVVCTSVERGCTR